MAMVLARRLWAGPGRVCAVVALAVAALPAVAPAQEPPRDAGTARNADTVIVAGDRAYPPFQFVDAQGRADGFDVALFRAIAAEAGLQPRFALGDWDASLQALEAGRVDVVPMFVTPERARRFLFSRPFLQRHHLAFARQGARYVARLEDLRGARVAVQKAGLAAEALAATGGVDLLRTALESDALLEVQRGAADYALVPTTIGYRALVEHGLDEVVAMSQPLLSLPYAFGVAPGRADLVRRIDAALARVQAAGVLDRLYLERLANLQPRPDAWRRGLLPAALAVLLLAALGLLAWRRRGARRGDGAAAALARELRAALAAGAVGFDVQPKLDLRSGAVTGVELLVRWEHPRRGPLAPAEFLPQAEQAGALGDLSLYMVSHAVRLWREWRAAGLELVMSVNVSIGELAEARVVDAIVDAVAGLPHMLRLEITEDTAMHSPEAVVQSLVRLRAHGVGISLDDFGTGHSSLSRLRRLAPEELKLDRSFVTGLLHSPSDQSIVRSSIDLAHQLGARFIAEGVEDQDTLDWLAVAGCDEVQGYTFARPMPPEQLPAFCARHRAAAVPPRGTPGPPAALSSAQH